MRELDGCSAGFSVASLQDVDRILSSFAEAGSDALAETIWGFGCYIGEVLIRNNSKMHWGSDEQSVFPVVWRSDESGYLNPIAKAFKRVDHGSEESIPYFYATLAAGSVGKPSD